MAIHMADAGDVLDGVLFCAFCFPLAVLDDIWDWTESVPENLSTYSLIYP